MPSKDGNGIADRWADPRADGDSCLMEFGQVMLPQPEEGQHAQEAEEAGECGGGGGLATWPGLAAA